MRMPSADENSEGRCLANDSELRAELAEASAAGACFLSLCAENAERDGLPHVHTYAGADRAKNVLGQSAQRICNSAEPAPSRPGSATHRVALLQGLQPRATVRRRVGCSCKLGCPPAASPTGWFIPTCRPQTMEMEACYRAVGASWEPPHDECGRRGSVPAAAGFRPAPLTTRVPDAALLVLGGTCLQTHWRMRVQATAAGPACTTTRERTGTLPSRRRGLREC